MAKPHAQAKMPVTHRSNELYERAMKVIPTGTMLLSKRPDNFAPDAWPPLVLLLIKHDNEKTSRAMKTFSTRSLLAQGFLSTGCHYLTLTHTTEDVDAYLTVVGRTMEELNAVLENGSLMEEIEHNPCRPHFKRLT